MMEFMGHYGKKRNGFDRGRGRGQRGGPTNQKWSSAHRPLGLIFIFSPSPFLSPPQRDYGPDCRLIERIEENKYNTYASAVWRHKNKHMFIGMTANGKIINAKKGRRRNINCHFLPLMVQPRWLDDGGDDDWGGGGRIFFQGPTGTMHWRRGGDKKKKENTRDDLRTFYGVALDKISIFKKKEIRYIAIQCIYYFQS